LLQSVANASPEQRPSLRSSIQRFNPRLLIILTLVFSLLLILLAFIEIRQTRREFSTLLQDQAVSLISLARKGLTDAADALDYIESSLAERLLDNARMLEEMDRRGLLTAATLTDLADRNDLFRVQVFDRNGQMIMVNNRAGGGGRGSGPRFQLQPLLTGEEDELILGFRQGRFGSGQRFAVAKRLRRGGVITVNADAEEMVQFRRTIGAGSFVRQMKEIPDVRYMVLQDSLQVVLASEGVTGMNTIETDDFLLQAFQDREIHSRFTEYEKAKTLEVVQSIEMEGMNRALLRIGLSTAHLDQAEKSARQRVALQSLLFLFIAVALSHFIISLQNYRTLQKAYQRMEGYFGGILAHMNEAVVALDRNGHVAVFNKAAERLFNHSAEQVIGKACSSLDGACTWLKQALHTRTDLIDVQDYITIREQRLFIRGDITVLRDSQGNLDSVFAVLRDLTHQQRMAEQIKRQEQLSAMGHLASGVAHEIRNPLNAISMIAQRLKLEFTPPADAPEYSHLTETVIHEAGRINEIIRQFLQFARPAPLHKQPVQPAEILRHVATLLTPAARQKNIALAVECRTTAEIELDRDKLQQALLNLVQNSIEACSSGDRIHLGCRMTNEKLSITVQDSGPGISEQDLPKIFHLYYTTRESGTGIGLSIVQQIVNQHNGVITVDSSPGKGALFTIELGRE
jgi:two-component system, NtrC family, sensor histidine kinase HydH